MGLADKSQYTPNKNNNGYYNSNIAYKDIIVLGCCIRWLIVKTVINNITTVLLIITTLWPQAKETILHMSQSE